MNDAAEEQRKFHSAFAAPTKPAFPPSSFGPCRGAHMSPPETLNVAQLRDREGHVPGDGVAAAVAKPPTRAPHIAP